MDQTKLKNIKDKVENLSKKVDTIMHNRLIIAIFMIVDGICFIIDPVDKIEVTAKFVAFTILLASFTVLITNIKSDKKDKKSIVIAIILIILCIYTIIFPELLAINLVLLLAIFIILNGLINIFNIIKLDKISVHIFDTENKIRNNFDKSELDKSFMKGEILEQTEKILNPFNSFIQKTNEKSILYFIANIISVILGIVLLVDTSITLILCGIILIYTGLCDVLMFAKSRKLSKFKLNELLKFD